MNRFKPYRTIVIISSVLLLGAYVIQHNLSNGTPENGATEERTTRVVTVATPEQLEQTNTFTVIGTVEAANEAFITSQTGGRVERVNITEGQQIGAGTIAVVLENSAQQASVRQAEAALQSARASAEQTGVGIREAQTAVEQTQREIQTTITTSYSSAQRIVINTINQFYHNLTGDVLGNTTPTVRIGASTQTNSLIQGRIAVSSAMQDWQTLGNTSQDDRVLITELTQARAHNETVISLINLLRTVIENETPGRVFDQASLNQLATTLLQERDQLIANRRSLDSAASGLEAARDAQTRAEIGGSTEPGSSASAQIAQAEAALDSARSQLNQTILRSPIAGIVNELDVTVGDFIGPGTRIAQVAGSDGVQIVAFVSPHERVGLQVGNPVTISGNRAGTIAAIAPTLDSVTRKQKVTIASNGTFTINDTVRVTFSQERHDSSPNNGLRLPITAVQFTGTEASVLIVDDYNVLQHKAVTLGSTRNDTVEITGGIDSRTEIVVDARGQRAGDTVEIQALRPDTD